MAQPDFPAPGNADAEPLLVILDNAETDRLTAPLYEVGTKVIFRNDAGEEAIGEVMAQYPEDPRTYSVFGDDGSPFGVSLDRIITPLFTGRAAMMHFDAGADLVETVDIDPTDMRLVDGEWMFRMSEADGLLITPDVLELPGDEPEAI